MANLRSFLAVDYRVKNSVDQMKMILYLHFAPSTESIEKRWTIARSLEATLDQPEVLRSVSGPATVHRYLL